MADEAPTRDHRASTAYHLGMFGLVSILAGLMVAGLLMPAVALTTTVTLGVLGKSNDLPATLPKTQIAQRSTVLMSNGKPLAQFYDQNRVYVPLAKIAPVMRKAQVAIEDRRFYQHGAIDLQGTGRALLRDVQGGATQGGSTLTQQYVKQMLIAQAEQTGDADGIEQAQEQTLSRKVREMRYALDVERQLSKDQILEGYLNIAYYGDGAYGVQSAAKHYFGVSADRLTLPQAAMLAGLVQDPTANNPVLHPQTSITRRNVVLMTMRDQGIITPAQYTAARAVGFDKSKVTTERQGCVTSKYPFLCQYVRASLANDPSLGKTREQRLQLVDRGGLTIQTLIDPTMQDTTQKAVSALVAPSDKAISTSVLIQPGTGLVLAMAQNRYVMGSNAAKGETYYNNSVSAAMGGAEGYQAGSTFKAFTAAAALNQGFSQEFSLYSPYSLQMGYRTYRDCQGPFYYAMDYTPTNTTHSEAGTFSMNSAAAKSINTYFLQLEQRVGICAAAQMAEAAGVQLANGKGLADTYQGIPSFTLGVAEVTPLSMADAYATFAAHGIHCDPIVIKSITSATGKPIGTPSANCHRVMSARVADSVASVLSNTMREGGTGTPAALDDVYAQAGKSGTIEGNAAVWFNGFTTEVAGVAMIAVDKTKHVRSVKGLVVHGTACDYGCELIGTGGGDAGRIWHRAMTAANDKYPSKSFTDPEDDQVPADSNGNTDAQVPDVVGKSVAEATRAITDAGFVCNITTLTSDKPVGTVLGTNAGRQAEPGATAERGSTVFLRVSGGKATS